MASADGDHPPPRLLSIPKEGERILAPTRRPDGTLRKPIRIRAGYVPQDEVAIYQSKGALLRKASQPEVPPGYDPALAEKPKTKSAKRNERKKEKRHQAAMEREKNMGLEQAEVMKTEEDFSAENIDQIGDSLESVTEKMNLATISETSAVISPSTSVVEIPKPESSGLITDKKIRALKKKIRLAEAQIQDDQQAMKPEQIEKIRKVEQWHEELKALEDEKKVNLGS